MCFVPLLLVVKDVDCVKAAGIARYPILGNKLVDRNHAIVFELCDFDGVFRANRVDVVEEGTI